MAKLLIIMGLLITAAGVVMLYSSRIPWLGRLPGDIHVDGKSGSFHFPVVTCLIVSVVLSIILNLFFRGR